MAQKLQPAASCLPAHLAGDACNKNVFMNVTDAEPRVFYYLLRIGLQSTIKSDDFIFN